MDLVKRLQMENDEHGWLPPGARLVVGVSGGPDSLALLDALTELAGPRGWRLWVACLDHGLRPEAAGEVTRVRREAELRGWPFETARVDTRAHAAAHAQSVEEAARALRYQFLGRAARAAGAGWVAVAHTADDQAETVLMHFLRGSGLAGLRGMRPRAPLPDPAFPEVQVVRPLLTVTRAEVEAYCRARGLNPLQDVTNHDTTFFRNRLRHELLPELERYNPNLRAVLGRTAAVAAGEYALVEAAVAAAWERVVRPGPPAGVVFDKAAWLDLAAPEQRALLRAAVQRLRPEGRDVDFSPIEAAVRFIRRAAPGRTADVLGGLRVRVTAAAVVVEPWAAPPFPADQPWLDEAGQLGPGWRFETHPLPAPSAPPLAPDPWSVVVDADRLPADLTLRRRRPGDRFQPLGLGGHSLKLADFMINAKMAAAWRERWPLVTAGTDAIVWVAGLRLAEPYKLTAATRRALRLSFVRAGGS